MTKEQLALQIYNTSHLTGEFKLRSGAISNEYFDKYQFESDPVLLHEIAEHAKVLVPDGTEVLAGLELGGVSIAALLSQVTGIPAMFVRKKAKEYGTCKLAEGPDVRGKRVVIVEDVVTSGGQVVMSGEDLRSLGAIITHVICVIDREQNGRVALREAGYTLLALFTMSELNAAASDSNSSQQVSEGDSTDAQPGTESV